MSTGKKIFTAVNVKLHNGNAETYDDYIDDNGKFINIGVQVAAALRAKRAIDIHHAEDNEELIIPYHAVIQYSISHGEYDYEAPEDAFCKPLDCLTAPICDEGDSGYTVTWVVGDERTTETYEEGDTPSYKGEIPQGCTADWSTSPEGEPISPLPPVTANVTYYFICNK